MINFLQKKLSFNFLDFNLKKNLLIFFLILFFSSFIFLYDEEKIIALCLISFAIIAYNNLNETVFLFFDNQSKLLEAEFQELFKEKVFIMRKVKSGWRIFLDIEDHVVAIYCWIVLFLKKSLKKKNLKRFAFFDLIIKSMFYNLILNKLTINNKFFNLLLKSLSYIFVQFKGWNSFTFDFFILKDLLKVNFLNFILILLKHNNQVIDSTKINYNYLTYLYIKWRG